MHVYLAGPIAGCTKGEAHDWRKEAVDILSRYGITGVSPLRCEPEISERYADAETYQLTYKGDPFGTAQGILNKNKMDVRKCDLALIHLPKDKGEERPSVGTMLELGWCIWAHKPIVLVTDDPYLKAHPLVTNSVGWIVDTIEEGAHICGALLGIYA